MWVLIVSLLLAASTFILHLPSAEFDFINYDDERVLCHHPEIYNQPGIAATLRSVFVDSFPREEPLVIRDLSWALDSEIFGFQNPHGYHFTNVLLHSIVVALLFVFLWMASGRRLFSLLTAMLFMLLAVHVESVAWISGRKDILASVFQLLSLLALHGFLTVEKGRSRILWYLLSLVMFGLALGSKINAIVFPGVLFLYALFRKSLRGEQNSISPGMAFKKGVLFLPHLLMSLAAFIWYNGVLTDYGLLDRDYSASFMAHIWNLVQVNSMVLVKYLRLILFPRNLSLFYLWPDHYSRFGLLHKMLALIILSGLLGLIVLFWRKRKNLLFFLLTFMVLMVPYLNIRYFGIWIANRYVYLSSFCILAILVDLLCRQLTFRKPIAAVLSVVILLLVALANLQAKLNWQMKWRDSETLWKYEISLPTTRVYAFENLASAYYSKIISTSDKSKKSQLLEKIDNIILQAENRFGENELTQASLYNLYLMKAMTSRIKGDDLETQLVALKQAEVLNPGFYATVEQLCIVYYQLALTGEGQSRKDLASRAFDYFEKYVNVCYRDRASIRKLRSMRQEFLQDFPFLSDKINAIVIEAGDNNRCGAKKQSR